MQYRKFGKLNWEVSILGFGAMRLPTKDGKIDEPEATKMLYHAIDQGVNYVDTAYPYHDGQSERFLGKALKDGYRGKVKLATKMPSWAINEATDFDKYFNEQCERLHTDRVDFYLLHSLNKGWWPKLRDLGVLDWAEKKIKEGRIGYLGFSFHDDYPAFEEIVDAYDWTFCQIQYNYMDIENQAGTKGLQYATSKGMAIIIMEPILGGNLANPPEVIRDFWETADTKRTPVDWALQWLWNQPEIPVVLSGMSTMEQVEENIHSAEVAAINALTEGEIAIFDKIREKYQELRPIPCTQCGYCVPCPNGVGIPRNFALYNEGMMFDNPEGARGGYNWLGQEFKIGISSEDTRATSCVQCKICDEKCPQSIPISQWMPVVHEVLGEGQSFRSTLS